MAATTRPHRSSPVPAPRRRAAAIVSVVALALGLVLAACGDDKSADTSGSGSGTTAAADAPVALEGTVNNEGTKDVSGDGDTTLEVEMDDDYFKPTFIKAEPGATLTIELKNEGKNQHTFSVDDGQVDEKVDPDGKATVEVTVPDSGALRFHCNFHGGSGMQGAIYGKDGDKVSAAGSDGSGSTTSTTAADSGDGY
jgi:plastocyanin